MPVGKVLGLQEEKKKKKSSSQEINQGETIREDVQERDSSWPKDVSIREQNYFGLSKGQGRGRINQ